MPQLPHLGLQSMSLDDIASYDAVVLVTAHPGHRLRRGPGAVRLLVDLRGVTRKLDNQAEAETQPAELVAVA